MSTKNISARNHENERLRGDLLTIATRISHDLRTPLGGIMAAGEALKEISAENKSSAMLVNSIFNSADEISKLIKQVSFLAKASANPNPKKKVNMGEIVSGTLQRLESRILNKPASVVEPGSWPEIEGVASWLEFIWWNFLANALQHGGAQIQLGWRREKNEFKFWISDNGRGVPAGSRAKLFQPFNSLHQPDSARGLGLSIVQRLVELQDGRCGYEISEAGGARFFFMLPDAASESAEP